MCIFNFSFPSYFNTLFHSCQIYIHELFFEKVLRIQEVSRKFKFDSKRSFQSTGCRLAVLCSFPFLLSQLTFNIQKVFLSGAFLKLDIHTHHSHQAPRVLQKWAPWLRVTRVPGGKYHNIKISINENVSRHTNNDRPLITEQHHREQCKMNKDSVLTETTTFFLLKHPRITNEKYGMKQITARHTKSLNPTIDLNKDKY